MFEWKEKQKIYVHCSTSNMKTEVNSSGVDSPCQIYTLGLPCAVGGRGEINTMAGTVPGSIEFELVFFFQIPKFDTWKNNRILLVPTDFHKGTIDISLSRCSIVKLCDIQYVHIYLDKNGDVIMVSYKIYLNLVQSRKYFAVVKILQKSSLSMISWRDAIAMTERRYDFAKCAFFIMRNS